MKQSSLLFVTLIFIFSINIQAHVLLDFPVGGETFEANATITIQWQIEIDHGDCNWDLYFSSDNGSTWQTIVVDLPKSQLTYDWVVPSIATQHGIVKVVQDNFTYPPQEDQSGIFTITVPSGIQENDITLNSFKLYPAYPNPFNPSTKIKYQLPRAGNVSLKIYDLLGKEVRTLVAEREPAGTYEVEFYAGNLSSGIYIYRLSSGKYAAVKKLVLLK